MRTDHFLDSKAAPQFGFIVPCRNTTFLIFVIIKGFIFNYVKPERLRCVLHILRTEDDLVGNVRVYKNLMTLYTVKPGYKHRPRSTSVNGAFS